MEFKQFCTDVLQENIRELEAKRISAKTWGFWLALAVILGVVLIFFLSRSSNNPPVILYAIISLIPAAICLYIYASKRKIYRNEFKEKVISRIIHFIDPTFDYEPASFINEKDYSNSGLYLKSYDRYNGDDYVAGIHGNTRFCFSELHTEYRVSSGKSTSYVTIFKGLFFIADFNKNFTGRTYVWSESDPQLNFFNKLFSGFSRGLEKVLLESPEFERRFIVYSNDQVESRYILSPSFMEKMMALQDYLKTDVTFSFVNTNIHVAVPISENLFEPSIFYAPTTSKLYDYYVTVIMVLEIIKHLDLDVRIWNRS